MNWYRKWRLRVARENYCEWKAKKEALERLDPRFNGFHASDYKHACGQVGKYEERVESLMRGQ